MSRRNAGRGGRRAAVGCLIGRHDYGEDHGIGAGISRRVCRSCGLVTIDLTRADDPSEIELGPAGSTVWQGSDR